MALSSCESDQLYATSQAIERWFDRLDRRAPINLAFLTIPLSTAIIQRVRSLETLYGKSFVFRFLLRRRLPPTLLFAAVTASLCYLAQRTYRQYTQTVLKLSGFVYPAWKCWKLIKRRDESLGPKEQLDQCRTWLTYWLLWGSMQVADNWSDDLCDLFPNYNVYSLILLYWAQNPHSKGAKMLHRRVLRKPEYYQDTAEAVIEGDDDMPELDRGVSYSSSTSSCSSSGCFSYGAIEDVDLLIQRGKDIFLEGQPDMRWTY